MEIVSIGEALIDFKSTGDLAFQGYPGGAPMNVAVAAARLGGSAGFLSQISTDFFGDRLVRHLEQSGVDTGLLLRSEAPTTLAFVEEREGEPGFQFLSNGAADATFDPRPRPELPPTVRWLMFGSISLLREDPAEAIVDVVRGLNGGRVLFDPNVRPTLIRDRRDYLEKLDTWVAVSDVVKASSQDLAWLGLSEEDVRERWLAGRTMAVVVTRGSEGVRLHRAGEETIEVPGSRVAVVDTVGAGDTFTGALLTRLVQAQHWPLATEEWHQALSFAGRAAALACTRPGADPPWKHELD